MKALRFILVLLVLTTLPFFAFGQKKKWQEALQTNTVKGYENFIKQNPKSDFNTEASKKILALKQQAEQEAWENTSTDHTRYAYQSFLEDYPKSQYADQAKKILKDHTYRNTRFWPAPNVNTMSDEKSTVQMSASKAYIVGNDTKSRIESIIGQPAKEEKAADFIKSTYMDISFWTEPERYYWADQGQPYKMFDPNTPRTLVLYYDQKSVLQRIETEP